MADAIYDVGSMWELVQARAAASPDRRMLVDESDRSITFGEFRHRCEVTAAGTARHGRGPVDAGLVAAAHPHRDDRALDGAGPSGRGPEPHHPHLPRTRGGLRVGADGGGVLLRPRHVEGLRLRRHGGEDRGGPRPSSDRGRRLRLAPRGRPGHLAPSPAIRLVARPGRGPVDLLHLGHDVGPQGRAPHRHHPRDRRPRARHGGGADREGRGVHRLSLRPHRRPRLPRHGARHRVHDRAARGVRPARWPSTCSHRHGRDHGRGQHRVLHGVSERAAQATGQQDHPVAARACRGAVRPCRRRSSTRSAARSASWWRTATA